MSHREKLVEYLQTKVDPDFDPDAHALTQVLDSVSMLQLLLFIDQELGIPIDTSNLTLEMFASLDTLLETLSQYTD